MFPDTSGAVRVLEQLSVPKGRFAMRLLALAALALVLGAGTAFAADPPAKPLTPQQQKMKDCNAEAAGKKGDERKKFMSACMKG